MDEKECFVCTSGGNDCRKDGITYAIECDECKGVYVGESARNGYTRGKEHMQAYKNKCKHSIMYRHSKDKHKDFEGKTKFTMKITGIYRNDPTLRQVSEGTKIKNTDNKFIINNKTEWNSGGIININIIKT